MNTKRTLTASLALVIIAASGMAAAGPEKKEQRDKDLLRGPKVTTTSPDKRRNNDDSMSDKSQRQANHPVIMRDYQLAFRQLQGKKSTQSLNLTDKQQEQVRDVMKKYRQEMKTFQEENLGKIQKIRADIKAMREANQDMDPEEKRERTTKAREKLQAFMSNASANKTAIAQLKQILTPEQQNMIKAHIKEARAKRLQGDQARERRVDRDGEAQDQRRRPNRDHVKRSDDKPAQRGKRSKKEQPSPEDDG
ncbi:MAG: Spy/CpxP family protein refolding chaperone [Phycisphaerales bacterium]|nr:Spy/CpxP family protein refolding chaperone [Phycisphaerales bacterium]